MDPWKVCERRGAWRGINEHRMDWKVFERRGIVEARPYVPGEKVTGVLISRDDTLPVEGDMIARTQDNHDEQWLIAKAFFAQNYKI